LNHASIIDGIRLCKARRYRYASSDMDSLESQLRQARADGARFIMIATDGVFSMDGHLAKLPEIRALADQLDASLIIDDCHATGFIGPNGAGTAAHFGVRADIITGTRGKALGGAMGGFVAASQPVVDLLRQRSRPYLFSNSLPPSIVAGTLAALDLVEHGDALRSQLRNNRTLWRRLLTDGGFEVAGADHPIMPVMTYDAIKSQKMAARLLELGVFVKGFFYPVVPKGQARIRTQMNARLTQDDLHDAAAKFIQAGRETGVLA
jgi:glycine C-acetyltransferase